MGNNKGLALPEASSTVDAATPKSAAMIERLDAALSTAREKGWTPDSFVLRETFFDALEDTGAFECSTYTDRRGTRPRWTYLGVPVDTSLQMPTDGVFIAHDRDGREQSLTIGRP